MSLNLSVYENVTPKKDSEYCGHEAIALIIGDILKVLGECRPVTFCPFCVCSFPQKEVLGSHLRSSHLSFLWELTSRSIGLDICPFCSAKLSGHHLIARHALIYHGNVLVEAFFSKIHGTVQCLFCPTSGDPKSMIDHLEEFHILQYNDWFKVNFHILPGGITGLVQELDSCAAGPSRIDIEDLNIHLGNMNVKSSPKVKKSILKNSSANEKRIAKLPVRRVLSFDDEEKENNEVSSSKIVGPKSSSKRKDLRRCSGSSWTSALRSSRYQCGKCSVLFPNHAQLVLHVKKEHRKLSLNLLHPFYQCALCGAKFFKNSYLRKHSSIHSLTTMR